MISITRSPTYKNILIIKNLRYPNRAFFFNTEMPSTFFPNNMYHSLFEYSATQEEYIEILQSIIEFILKEK